jgi:hypothetical protein
MRLSLVVEAGDNLRDGAGESVGVSESAVGELMLLEVAPASFNVVQFRGVFRQPFDGQPGPRGQRGRGELAGMNGTVIENEDDWLIGAAATRTVNCVQPAQKIDEIAAALGRAGADDQPVRGKVSNGTQTGPRIGIQ